MKEPDEIRIAWVIWNLLSYLNDILWDRYEGEFLEFVGDPQEREQMAKFVGILKGSDPPF